MTSPDSDPLPLKDISSRTIALLKERDPNTVKGVSPEDHTLPPFLPKNHWTCLGDAIKLAEKPTCEAIPGDFWISLRCDGTGFSKLTKKLRKEGILEAHGWSETFATIMIKCCQVLMEKFNAKCAYTQSDEMTILIAPANIVRGEQQPHPYNGRVQKLATLAASLVTAHFNHAISRACSGSEKEFNEKLLATFDCRVGMYRTEEEAISLLLWRSYDCGVNGVSDAVYHCKGKIEGAGQAVKLGTREKLKWLAEHSLLPLHAHQRDGTYFVKYKRVVNAINGKTGEAVTCLRSVTAQVPGNVLVLCKNDGLFLADEVLRTESETTTTVV